jgi:hypothetical protein
MLYPSDEQFLPKMIQTEGGFAPESPGSVAATGIDRDLLLDLVLKAMHVVPHMATDAVALKLHLPHVVVHDLMEQLRTDFLLEALGQSGPFGYRYSITQRGRERASRLLEISGYIGPAPVSLDVYRAMLMKQADEAHAITPAQVKHALADLVLPEKVVEIAGIAMSASQSLFLSGPAGNGKTTLGRLLHNAQAGDTWIPHCITIDHSIIRLYDPHCHQIVTHAANKNQPIDQRWIKVKRPFIVAGGEMTLQSLDLSYLPSLRYYEAPLHMKANGGTFMIDDFGRQHVSPEELLNRWIIPLEHHIDFLTLHTGQKIQVPFLLVLIIATNLDPKTVTDPAFLRRLGYRLTLEAPTPDLYSQIFRQYAEQCGADASDDFIAKVLQRYEDTGRELRCCEPRDLIDRMRDICYYHGRSFILSDKDFQLAWEGYFGS